jgi:hypothetical protein
LDTTDLVPTWRNVPIQPRAQGTASALTKSCRRSVRVGWVRSIARDTKLNRDVALKILPDAFARHGGIERASQYQDYS